MPVILNGAAIDAWLTGDAAAAPALPMANELMQVIPWKLSIDRAPATFGHDPGLSAGLREGPRGTPRGADRWTPVARTRPIKLEESMAQTHHTKAAEHHEAAAKSHRGAADAHGKNDHSAAHEHSTKAHGHSTAAHTESTAAHGKSTAAKK